MTPFTQKNTPSVFCLFLTLFCFAMPLFSQTPAIDAAEKALDVAKLDSLNPPPYAAALREVWAAYRAYIYSEKDSIKKNIDLRLIKHDSSFRILMDSLVLVAKKTKSVQFLKAVQLSERRLLDSIVEDLGSLGEFYGSKQNVRKAKIFYTETLIIFKRINDKANQCTNIINLSVCFKFMGNSDSAIAILQNGLLLIEQELKIKPKNKIDTFWALKIQSFKATFLKHLSHNYKELGDYENAVLHAQKSINITKKYIVDSLFDVGKQESGHWYLSDIYMQKGKLDSASLIAKDGLEVYKKYTKHSKLLLTRLCEISKKQGNIQESLRYAQEAHKLNDGGYVEKLYLYAIYLSMGHYTEALKWLENAEIDLIDTYGLDSYLGGCFPKFIKGIIFNRMGNYAKSKIYLEKSLFLIDSLGIDKSQTTDVFSEYSVLLYSIGQFDKILKIDKEICEIALKTTFENSPQRAFMWANLSTSFRENNMLDSALHYIQKSIEIHRNIGNHKSIEFTDALAISGRIKEKQRNYIAAEKDYRESLDYTKKINGLSPNEILRKHIRLARILRKQVKNLESIKENKECFSILKDSLSNATIDDYARVLLNTSLTSEIQKNNIAAIDSLSSTFQHIEQYFNQYFNYLSEKEKTAFMSMLDQDLFGTMQAAFARLYLKGEAAQSGALFYNTLLLQKELSVIDTRSLKYKASLSGDSVLQEQVYKIGFWQDKLAEKDVSATEQVKITKQINETKAAIETKYPQFFEKNALVTNWQSVQSKLKPNEIAIEYADVLNNDDDTTSIRNYYALVIKADSKYPSVIPLFEEAQLKKLLDESLVKEHFGPSNTLQVVDKKTVEQRYNKEFGKKLYDLIWQPLENSGILSGVQTVHFAPSGLLNRVAFAALPVGDNLDKLLLQTYQLRQYNTTRALVETTPRLTPSAKDLVAFGNIQYGSCQQDSSGRASIETMPLEKADGLVARSALFLDSTTIHWQDLPSSKRELANIESSHKKYQPTAAFTAFTGYNASEARFKTLGTHGKPSPSHLFISTHGFGNPTNYPESRYASAALHRAGLVMATANWTTECHLKRGDSDDEDGILTAYEIAQLNLSNTELVVLSGCQTGLGDIWGREGVFGLTRGFKLAGVNNIIASLWSVPDADTAEFMSTFYDLYLSGKSINAAFEETQKAMQQKQSAYSWAAWVLIR